MRRRSLDWVANYYGVEIGARHRAGGDAIATAHCLVRMLDSVADSGCECWDDLETMLALWAREGVVLHVDSLAIQAAERARHLPL